MGTVSTERYGWLQQPVHAAPTFLSIPSDRGAVNARSGIPEARSEASVADQGGLIDGPFHALEGSRPRGFSARTQTFLGRRFHGPWAAPAGNATVVRMQGATFVRVDCRGFVLAARAQLVPLDDERAFVALETPAPVRSLLAIHGVDGDVRALEITAVHEYPTGPTGERGCVGRFVDYAALHRAARVGTESLARPSTEAPMAETRHDPSDATAIVDAPRDDDDVSGTGSTAPPEGDQPYADEPRSGDPLADEARHDHALADEARSDDADADERSDEASDADEPSSDAASAPSDAPRDAE